MKRDCGLSTAYGFSGGFQRRPTFWIKWAAAHAGATLAIDVDDPDGAAMYFIALRDKALNEKRRTIFEEHYAFVSQ